MKKIIVVFIIIVFQLLAIAQKQYEFDYFLVYQQTFFSEDTISKNKIYLTNSKDNSYHAILYESDSLTYSLILHDNNELHSNVKINKEIFTSAENINIDCNNVLPFKRNPNNLIKDYRFHKLKDTIIRDKAYYSYLYKSTLKEKKVIRKKIGSCLYIIDKSTDFHLPVFDNPSVYQEWNTEKIIPTGIFLEKIIFRYNGEIINIEKLESFKKLKKKINVIGDCYQSKDPLFKVSIGFEPD